MNAVCNMLSDHQMPLCLALLGPLSSQRLTAAVFYDPVHWQTSALVLCLPALPSQPPPPTQPPTPTPLSLPSQSRDLIIQHHDLFSPARRRTSGLHQLPASQPAAAAARVAFVSPTESLQITFLSLFFHLSSRSFIPSQGSWSPLASHWVFRALPLFFHSPFFLLIPSISDFPNPVLLCFFHFGVTCLFPQLFFSSCQILTKPKTIFSKRKSDVIYIINLKKLMM